MTDEEMQEVLAMDFLRVPNVFFKVRPKLKPSEFSCLLFIWQKTGGWSKTHDHISISQFESDVDGVGLTRRTIQSSLKSLVVLNLIEMQSGYNNLYKFSIDIKAVLLLSDQVQGVQKTTQGVQLLPQGVQKTTSRGANSAPTIDTIQKNNTIDKTIDSKEVKKKVKKEPILIFRPEKPELLTQAIWDDLLTHRKSKKATNTETAWNTIFNAIQRAQQATGHSLDQIVSYWIMRDWKGFNDKWYLKDNKPQSAQVNRNERHYTANNSNQPKRSQADIYADKLNADLAARFPDEFAAPDGYYEARDCKPV